ncbi:Serine hydroxymethyltransferase [Buchnera aphidicola (Cinara kochiana kochiana)]|uniref:Serine hydroxymethyltransferase n=1 Tax=Buchnera aphidicola (Cinara kochiana kochiana) TaxID=2518976 RepID=A0A451D5N9_9GAMM|nr:serine hydroxymethyltransferase [Buchnera aphidicola]VFP81103.1 Serine hydroxymethyltransferase [Buchnera aphidicola (Cinara kochiana kochiana)]
MINKTLKKTDLKIWNLINKEKIRQESYINLIASENYASSSILEAQGSCLTNKYAEGYIGNRFYNGCKIIDHIESIAIRRAKKLFNVDYANVQPHSGSQANFAIFQALLKPQDVILGMNLNHGGHLTHGSTVNFSGKIYKSYTYGVNKKGDIDYEEFKHLCILHHPKLIIGGFSAYSGICDWKYMRKIADKINAYFLVDISHVAGLIIAGLYPNPLNYAHVVSTTTHKTLGGPRGGLIISKNGNKQLYSKLDASVFPGTQGGPLMHVIAAKAVAFKEALNKKFSLLQKNILFFSKKMVKVFLKRKFTVILKKTENHLFLIDVSKQGLTGKEASNILSHAGIIVNKNTIPNDCKNPFITSGIRIGTPAIVKRNIKINDVIKITNWICDILSNPYDLLQIKSIRKKIKIICKNYPIYKI